MVVLAELCGMVLSEKTTLPDSILEINFCDMPNTVSYRHFRTSPEIIQHAVMLYLAGLKFTPKKNSLSLPDANTRLQAVISGNGLGMQDEFAEPEIESGQLVWLSEIAISNFAYCIVIPTKGQLSPAANIFVDWMRAQDL
jgi:DNA-binding transcriptional LysR family regulator|tara:strand:+ start:539 stop:958 length:420 start_codon:yes stop_codon:yes gene_type:complete